MVPADIWEAATLALGHRLPHDPFVAGPYLDPMAIKHELEDFLEISLELKKSDQDDEGTVVITTTQPIQVGVSEMRLAARQALSFRRTHPFFVRSATGRRCEAIVSQRRGKYSRARLASTSVRDVALDATLRAAASRLSGSRDGGLEVWPEDIRERIRRHRSPYVIALVMDNSWSIHVDRTLETTKGVVPALLKDARARKDKVAIIAFCHNRRPDATVCLPPTSSYSRALSV